MRYRVFRAGKLIFIMAAAGAFGWMVMVLWNAVIPAVFAGSRPIDYWHALGMLLLSRILFGGFRGHGGWRRHRHGRSWEAMTPEEREQLRQALSTRREHTEEPT